MTFKPQTTSTSQGDDLSIISSVDTLQSAPQKPAPRFHPRYYVHKDLTVILVNDEVWFRIPRHLLDRESAEFRSYPTGTEDNPILLMDVGPDEFETMLDYFYDSVRTPEQWIQLLSVSNRFGMDKAHRRAIKELENVHVDPIEKILLAKKYGLSAWLCPAYLELCKREEPLSDEEAEKLGIRTMASLARARENIQVQAQIQREVASIYCDTCAKNKNRDVFYCPGCTEEVEYEGDAAMAPAEDDAQLEKIIEDVFEGL